LARDYILVHLLIATALPVGVARDALERISHQPHKKQPGTHGLYMHRMIWEHISRLFFKITGNALVLLKRAITWFRMPVRAALAHNRVAVVWYRVQTTGNTDLHQLPYLYTFVNRAQNVS
jgi:hypothetical protein